MENFLRESISLIILGVFKVLRGICKIKELNEYEMNKNLK